MSYSKQVTRTSNLLIAILVVIYIYVRAYQPALVGRMLYYEGGWLESIVPLLLLASAILIVLSARQRSGGSTKIVLWFCASVLLIVAMEEVSWGQHLFGWSTPEDWAQINRQRETNLHNLLNRYFGYIYGGGFALLTLFSLFSNWLKSRLLQHSGMAEVAVLIRPRELICYTPWFAVAAMASLISGRFLTHNPFEIMEQGFALFAFAYSLNTCLSPHSNSSEQAPISD